MNGLIAVKATLALLLRIVFCVQVREQLPLETESHYGAVDE